ncbi:phosphate transport system protein [Haloferula luteola]|uniref:Phosphate-specific transport system accessory protein PhoU n=1 Tax=Haloferula luteola TaxID=595692 RepID=A0A840V7X1_9BACT|nr:phosphate signaling complex protein PhoU [Haloferula luteola]MBB5349859.1 phosphate transport system protein [Haloferula luteola]
MPPNHPHIIRDFDESIRKLSESVISMGNQSRLNLQRAVEALIQRDIDRCKAVIADDSEIDEAERSVDAMGMDILLRFHPVARDLRLVISSMKAVASLERISDHAVNIAKRAKKMLSREEIREVRLIEPIYLMADELLRDALASFADRDSTTGRNLAVRDKELDRAHKRVVATLSQLLEEGGANSESYLHLILIVRSLERVGDLAVNVGEDAVFLDAAEDIRYAQRRYARESDDPDTDPAP